MNREEILNKYIDLIDKGYCSDCNELNCIDNFPHAKITHAIRELQQENQKLKKQLKNYKKLGFKYLQDKNNNLEAQQKEFVKYLEDEIKNIKIKWGNKLNEKGYIDIAMTVRAYQIILQKYKEIIGGK